MAGLTFGVPFQSFQIFKFRSRCFKNCLKQLLISHSRMLSSNISSANPIVAVCQVTSKSDKAENYKVCSKLIEQADSRGAQMVFLPEALDFIAERKDQAKELAEPIDGPLITQYRELAKELSIWLSLGSVHVKDSSTDNRVSNTHVIINEQGEITGTYSKIHMFDIDLPKMRIRESDYTIRGEEISSPVLTPVGKVGLGICYDLRFPEFSLTLAKAGADILTYPSAFTVPTGMAHWEALLRARAIESQCYVIAAAQVGQHNPKRASYGHAMVIDPWGSVVAQSSDNVGIITAEINLDLLKKVRESIPVWNHRRTDLYGQLPLIMSKEDSQVQSTATYNFGQVVLKSTQIFFKTSLSMAFVNKMPVLPGHVLVAPLRQALRHSDLTPAEVTDMFIMVQKVQKAIEQEYKVNSSTVAIQDGPDAGRSIDHLHVHILPRRPGDFERNDDVYQKLQEHDKDDKKVKRTEEEMALEANTLRKYFYKE